MVKTVKGWMQNWVHALIQRACYPKFAVIMKKWEFTVLSLILLHLSLFPVDTRITEYTDVNPKGAAQCTVGDN